MGQILLNDLLEFSEEEIKNEHEIMQSIEKHRKSLGYKQYEFAEMMGLTPVQYSKIKSGRRALYSLSKVFSA